MILCPTPTWRTPRRQPTRLALGLLLTTAACTGPAGRSADPDAAVTRPAPATAAPLTIASRPPPPAPPAPATAAPVSQPLTALFSGDAPTIPSAFAGLEPAMPMVAAKVIFPSLATGQVIAAPFAGLRFRVLGDDARIYSLHIATASTPDAPKGARLRALLTERWGPGVPTKDENGLVVHFWLGEGGLRVRHRQLPEGGAEVIFDAWQTVPALVKGPLKTLRGLVGGTFEQARAAFEFTQPVDDEGLEVFLPAMPFGRETTALLTANADGRIRQITVHLSFAWRTSEKATIRAALRKALGKGKPKTIDGHRGFRTRGIDVVDRADKWRLYLR